MVKSKTRNDMEYNELFGERHEQEENGLYGRRHAELCELHSVSDCFSFARYLNENFHYFDNTDVGDVYKDNDGQGLYSEKDIYDEWLNNR